MIMTKHWVSSFWLGKIKKVNIPCWTTLVRFKDKLLKCTYTHIQLILNSGYKIFLTKLQLNIAFFLPFFPGLRVILAFTENSYFSSPYLKNGLDFTLISTKITINTRIIHLCKFHRSEGLVNLNLYADLT